jgi:chromosome segregation ATPase
MTLLWTLLAALAVGVRSGEVAANPIRKVVNLLQKMGEKIESEGEKEKELNDKFVCYCKTELADFEKGKADLEAAVSKLTADIQVTNSSISQLQQEIETKKAERAEVKEIQATTQSQREQEHSEYAKADAERHASIDAMSDALRVLNKSKATGFLQSKAKVFQQLSKEKVRRLQDAVLSGKSATETDRELISSFFDASSTETGDGDVGTVRVLLEHLQDEAKVDDSKSDEQVTKSVDIFNELMTAKKGELQTIEETVAQKIDRLGELRVLLVEQKGQLSDAQKSASKDFTMLENLAEQCKARASEWEVRTKTRAEEVQAIQETINILNNDEALDTFKKTLPSPSLLQVRTSTEQLRLKLLGLLSKLSENKTPQQRAGMDLLAVALSSKGVDFAKVQKMIDGMIELTKKEQKDDDDKKTFCKEQFFEAERKVKDLTHKLNHLQAAVQDGKSAVETLEEEISKLTYGLADLDKAVAEATKQRQQEHSEYQELLASDSQAKDLLHTAKNRLNQFYHPELPQAKLSTDALFLQVDIKLHDHQAPEGLGEFKKQEGSGNNVLQMLDTLVRDLDAEMAEAKHDEANAQKLYQRLLEDAKAKRTADSQVVADKQKAKAEAETNTIRHGESARAEAEEIKDVELYQSELHGTCDWLLTNFDARKEARSQEQETLTQSKAVLAGTSVE